MTTRTPQMEMPHRRALGMNLKRWRRVLTFWERQAVDSLTLLQKRRESCVDLLQSGCRAFLSLTSLGASRTENAIQISNGIRVCVLDLSVTKVKTIPTVVKIPVLSGYLRRIRTCSRLVCQIDTSMWVVQESAEVCGHSGRSPMSSRTLSSHLPELEEHSASVQMV